MLRLLTVLRRLSLGLCVVLVGSLLLPPAAVAQAEEPPVYRVETTQGAVFIGTLIEETEDTVVLLMEDENEVRIQRANIRSMRTIDPAQFRDGQYWHPNPQPTRYLFGPNALGVRAGTGYYQNAWIFFNNVNYGVSNRVSIGAGTVPIFLFGASAVPLWLLPKVSIPTPQDNLHLAAGAVLGGVVGAGGGVGVGMFYGAATLGDEDQNLTGGIGYGYADGSLAASPFFTLSGMTRVSRNVYLISENYFFAGDEVNGLVSIGVRYAPERFAVDFGLVRPLADVGSFVGLPWLGVSIPFN